MLRVIAIFVIIYLGKAPSNGHADIALNNKYFPLGVIGCMVGDGLCGAKESCIDDNLFGICSENGLPLQPPNYDLTDPQRIGLLESKILKLLIEGYTWQDAYTQCIVQNLLVASAAAAATSVHAALPLDCGGGGDEGDDDDVVGGEAISPSLLARWSLLNDDAEEQGVMAGSSNDDDVVGGDRGIPTDAATATATMGRGAVGGDGDRGENSDGGHDDDDDDGEEEEEAQNVGGGMNYNSDVFDSAPPQERRRRRHPSFLRSSKRDEIVRIHKYFDQPAVPSRRSSGPPLMREENLAERYGLPPNGEPNGGDTGGEEQNRILARVFSEGGGGVVDEDDDGVIDREALRLMNQMSASDAANLVGQGNDNVADGDGDADPDPSLGLNTLAYVPPGSLRFDSDIVVAAGDDDDQNAYNNNNNDDGDDGNDDGRSLKRSAAKDLAAFDDGGGADRNQMLPQYLLNNLQNLLAQEIGGESETETESETESERERERESIMDNDGSHNGDSSVRNTGRQHDETANKMTVMDYSLPDYSLLSEDLAAASDYKDKNDGGRRRSRVQPDDGGGASSLGVVDPAAKGLWREDFKQMQQEADYDYDYPTAAAISDPRFPVFKSSLKSEDPLPNVDRTIDSDKLDLTNADSEALKTLLKDILLKAVDDPVQSRQSIGASLRDRHSKDGGGFVPSTDRLTDIDMLQLRQAEALLGKPGQLKPKNSLRLEEGGMHPKFTLLQRVGEPVNKKAVKMANNKDDIETATVSEKSHQVTDPQKHYDKVDTNYAFVGISDGNVEKIQALKLVRKLEEIMKLPSGTFSGVRLKNGQITFRISPDVDGITASTVAKEVENHHNELEAITGLQLSTAGIGDEVKVVQTTGKSPKYYTLTFVLCGCIATAILAVVAFYMFRQHHQSRQKLAQLSNPDTGEASKDYQDLCRQKMQSKSSEKPEPLHAAATRIASVSEAQVRSPSSRSSTSSWSEEPVSSNMDISTGHIVLSYMEDHLQNRDRLDQEWEALCAYEADPCCTDVAMDTSNARKNRYSDVMPYNHSRVLLNQSTNASGSDYINASTITDHDPKNPAYIATQGPLPHTVADFWQMVWEQGSVVIVMLTKLTENADVMCHRYWPEEGSDLYHIYEVHLVSEHIWCDDYLVRSFYLKNLQTNETRTVTQFHFLSWLDLTIPTSVKVLLDFRRKVNKSFRGRSCPIVVHCNDGVGRTGTYILMDMVLNRMAKGAKEIDIAATLEHIRDQRMNMVKVKEQFQYSLALVAEEVHAILKALPQ